MYKLFTSSIIILSSGLSHSVNAAHEELPELTISGERSGYENFIISPDELAVPSTDSAQLLTRVPGANVNRNGMLTGLAQYRGLFGNRVNLLIDGTKIDSAGPNSMDPGLSYIPSSQLQSLEVIRGIAPVSSGNETIGGTMRAKSSTGQFGQGEAAEFHGKVSVGGHSVDSGYDVSTLLSLANRNHRIHASLSRQDGDDYEFDGGDVTPSEYERNNIKLGYGFKQGAQAFSLEYLRNDTGSSGTPALPMDIDFVEGDVLRANFQTRWNNVQIKTNLHGSQIDHRMSNFRLRLPPLMGGGAGPMTMQRFTFADSDSFGWGIDAAMPFAGGTLEIGTDGNLADHQADVFDPRTTAFKIQNFNQVERDIFGLFGEWNGEISQDWDLQLGVRYTHVKMDAGQVSATGFPMAMLQMRANALAATYNSADHSVDDNNVDLVVKLNHALAQNLQMEIGLARKTRSPSYQERYLWLPLQSTGGLADGNNYIGDINLDPEVAYQLELGLEWQTNRAYFTPRAFYHHVNDYIQGDSSSNAAATAFNTMINTMTGNSARLLQFSNIDARLFGLDAGFGYQFNSAWRVDGSVSVVKGERRDNGDNLYRVSPVNARLGLTHDGGHWSYTLETEAYMEQDDVSAVTNEQESAGYALLNLYGHYDLPISSLQLSAGIDNLLDQQYRPHLGGINRVRGVDVARGQRLPGPGRNAFINLSMDW